MKQKKVLYSAVGAAVIIAGGSYLYFSKPSPVSAPDNTMAVNNASPAVPNTNNSNNANTAPTNTSISTSDNSLILGPQRADSPNLVIDTVVLTEPGFVVI